MHKKKSKRASDQRKRFMEKARELGLDVTEAQFDEQLRRVLKGPPPKKQGIRKRKDKPG